MQNARAPPLPSPPLPCRLVEHLTALAMFAWSVKSRRAPSRHCRDAKVYGHTTKAMHDNEYTIRLRRCVLLSTLLLVRPSREKKKRFYVVDGNNVGTVGRVSIRRRNGAPSRKGCVVTGQMTEAPPRPPHTPLSVLLSFLPMWCAVPCTMYDVR